MKKINRSLSSVLGWLTFASLFFGSIAPFSTAMNLSRIEPGINKKDKANFRRLSSNEEEKIKESLDIPKNGFEENRGQFDSSVRFVAQRANQSIFLTAKEAVFTTSVDKTKKKTTTLRMEFGNANENSIFSGLEAFSGEANYFRGNDPKKWQTEVTTFGKVKYEEIYRDIDLLWYSNEAGELEYDFIVAPSADYRQIELKFKGAKKLEVTRNGDLLIKTDAGTLIQRKPFTYQMIDGERKKVASRYKLTGKDKIRFIVDDYDRAKELIIDPAIITYSTFLGGSDEDFGNDIAVDNQGNVYIVGTTRSNDFPTTRRAFDDTFDGTNFDVIVTKFNVLGRVAYSTYIGGSSYYGEKAYGIDVDNEGNAYIVGMTYSADFPVTAGAFSRIKKGDQYSADVFVTKLNPRGSALLYSTFLGGTDSDEGYDIAVDSVGNANVVGETGSYPMNPVHSFPVTPDSLPALNSGSFYTKLNALGSGLIYSTYLSGSSSVEAKKVVADNNDNIYVMGVTNSFDLITTYGAFDTTYNGYDDVFVMKFAGATLQYSTFLGGSSYDGINNGFGLAVDNSGYCYVLAPTGSDDFPTTEGALDRTRNNYEAFVAKLNPQGSALVFSTFLSPLNNGPNIGYALAVDSIGNVYVSGTTGADLFPGMDCTNYRYVAQIAPDGSAFKNINCYDQGFGNSFAMVIDSARNLYTTGYSYWGGYPTTPNAFDRTLNGNDDIVFTKHRFINMALNSDFDGDGKSDPTIFRNGTWNLQQTAQGQTSMQFGTSGDIPIPADFDGDGKTDFAVWRASTEPQESAFYILQSSNNAFRYENFGQSGDDPTVAGDYDGDGRADLAVYRNAVVGEQSYFYYRGTEGNPTGEITSVPWGTKDDKPTPGDYNGDGRIDFAVFRPSSSVWFIGYSGSATSVWKAEQFGLISDKLVQADYDGDGKTDIAVFRPSNGFWYIRYSSNNTINYLQWGLETDTPIPSDYDGDGKTDPAVWRDGGWFIKRSSDGRPDLSTALGTTADQPVQSVLVH